MTYEYYINQPKSICERQINLIIAKNPHLKNSLNRNKNLSLIRKKSYITFDN